MKTQKSILAVDEEKGFFTLSIRGLRVSVYPWPSPTSTQTLRSPSNSPQPARTTTLPNLEMCSIAYAVSIKFASRYMYQDEPRSAGRAENSINVNRRGRDASLSRVCQKSHTDTHSHSHKHFRV